MSWAVPERSTHPDMPLFTFQEDVYRLNRERLVSSAKPDAFSRKRMSV